MKNHIAAVLISLALAGITATAANAGSLIPPGTPASTMRNLEQMKPAWNKIIPAAQRFEDALDGTAVLDKETGLVWAKAPDTITRTWQEAMDSCTKHPSGGRRGWRLPTIEELSTLVEPATAGAPKLPVGHPFTNVQSSYYWSSSTYSGDSTTAWLVHFATGAPVNFDMSGPGYAWPVRSGQ